MESPRPPRRIRYSGKNPRRWDQKYKEHRGDSGTLEKVLAGGKTPAGTHRPIMVAEILTFLKIVPGQVGVDATLGFGGHAQAVLPQLLPGGRLIGLDVDPVQLPRTEARLRGQGFSSEILTAKRSNFAGVQKVLAELAVAGADFVLADLGVSSMQIDNPARGFSFKHDGPLDMRMNPQRGAPASELIKKCRPEKLEAILTDNADEPAAAEIAHALAGREFLSTGALSRELKLLAGEDEWESAARRVFQALRIAVNEEFSALEALLRQLPACLNPGGRVAILTFHSGEDRRVKKSFAAGHAAGIYCEVPELQRASAAEIRENPRASSAKLRMAVRSS